MTGGLTMGPGAEFTLGLPVVNVVKGMMKSLQKSEDFIHGKCSECKLILCGTFMSFMNHSSMKCMNFPFF